LLCNRAKPGCYATEQSPVAVVQKQEKPSKVWLYTKIVIQGALTGFFTVRTIEAARFLYQSGNLVQEGFAQDKAMIKDKVRNVGGIGTDQGSEPQVEAGVQLIENVVKVIFRWGGGGACVLGGGLALLCGWCAYRNIQKLRALYKEEVLQKENKKEEKTFLVR